MKPMCVAAVRAMFEQGALGWLAATREQPLGLLARTSLDQIESELERSFGLGSDHGDADYGPQDLLPAHRDVVRDSCMGTMGGGNHFLEVQVVEEALDKACACAWGVRRGQVAIMVHSGSRRVAFIGGEWMERACERWPHGAPHPTSGIFAPPRPRRPRRRHRPEHRSQLRQRQPPAAPEMARDRVRQVYGRDLEMPLVFDVPHNTITREGDHYVHRKGATPAHAGQPVLIPGSMGQASYLMVGLGNGRFFSSASHGAGRARTRGDMRKSAARGEELGLAGVECVTLQEERVIEEAPAAYKGGLRRWLGCRRRWGWCGPWRGCVRW